VKQLFIAALLLLPVASALAVDKYIYVGDGRYVCRGPTCGEHNARQAARDRAEAAERRWRESESRHRERMERSGSQRGWDPCRDPTCRTP
jgi:hypothetical protein